MSGPSRILLFAFAVAAACSPGDPIGPDPSGGGNGAGGEPSQTAGTGGSGGSTDATTSGGGAGEPCPDGVICITTFPFTDQRDTTADGTDLIPSYACSSGTDEGGREIVYRVAIPSDGFLSAAVYDDATTDIDVHILSDFDPDAPSGSACVDRGDRHARADVTAGYAWIVADTWVSATGEQAGAFTLDVGFLPVMSGPCELQVGEMARVGDGGQHLAMPATGPVVQEAHLVTQEEPAPYPAAPGDELAQHYALSQAATGLVMFRGEDWAPLEGGTFYGAGIWDPPLLPVVDEGWYVNMYWTPAARPPRGARMILREPGTSRAVVVAAGYETGPGNLGHIAGTPEETHFYLRTESLSALTLGLAVDQSLPLGPRDCTDP